MTLDTNAPRLGDNAIYSGQWGQWRYYGLVQFSLPPLPSDASIIGAQLVLYTQSESNVNGGDWVVQTFSSDVDNAFSSLSYPVVSNATLLGRAGPALDATQLGARTETSRFNFSPNGITQLQARLASTQKVTYRLEGPNSGNSLQQWDSGYGYGGFGPAFKPMLRVTYTTASAFGPSSADLPLLP